MSSQPAAERSSTIDEPMAEVRALLAAANRRLLGDTIEVRDAEWRAGSLLPGWSRGHVASHIARHAEAFARLAEWARTGEEIPMYPGDRDAEIDAGADRDGLQIQTDLDTSAGHLEQEFEKVAEEGAWDHRVRLRDGREIAARLLPYGRLLEVVVHHLDLDIGLTIDDVDQRTAELGLEWCAFRIGGRKDYPRLRLITGSGRSVTLGPDGEGEPVEISGPANLLLGWVTRRSGTDGLDGRAPELPSFG